MMLAQKERWWFIIFKEAIKFGKFQTVLDNFLFFIYIAVVISFLKLYTWPSHSISLFLLGIVSTWMSVMCVSERMNDITKLLHTLIGRSFTYYSIPTEFRGQFLELVWNKHPLWTWSFRLLYFSRSIYMAGRTFTSEIPSPLLYLSYFLLALLWFQVLAWLRLIYINVENFLKSIKSINQSILTFNVRLFIISRIYRLRSPQSSYNRKSSHWIEKIDTTAI